MFNVPAPNRQVQDVRCTHINLFQAARRLFPETNYVNHESAWKVRRAWIKRVLISKRKLHDFGVNQKTPRA